MPDFPIGPRAKITPGLLNRIAQQYALPEILRVQDLGGAYNLNILIETHQDRYVARVFRPWVTPERLLGIQRVKSQLQQAGIPVILPIPTAHGPTFFIFRSRLVELEPFLPHAELENTWTHYRLAFQFLGRLHRVFALEIDSSTFPPPNVENYALPAEMLAQVTQARRRIEQSHHPGVAQAVEICTATEKALRQIQGCWQINNSALPRQLVHGDFGLGNLLIQQNQIVAILDFDFLAIHERIFDLAYGFFFMFERMDQAQVDRASRSAHISEMIQIYQESRGLSLNDTERRSLWIEMARVPLYWIAEASLLPEPVQAVLSHAEQVAFALRLLEE